MERIVREAESGSITRDEQLDRVFKAIASRPRREILALLASGTVDGTSSCCGGGEVCACDLVSKLGLGAPTISHHMKALTEAGLVAADKRGSWVYYQLRWDTARLVSEELAAIVGLTPNRLRP